VSQVVRLAIEHELLDPSQREQVLFAAELEVSGRDEGPHKGR
jgi:hypothetical protein